MPLAYFFVENVRFMSYYSFLRFLKNDLFFMLIILPLRKTSLRELMQNNAINGSNKRRIYLRVLKELKPIVTKLAKLANLALDSFLLPVQYNHGDLKEFGK